MKHSIFALLALAGLALPACNPPIDTIAGTGVELDEQGCPVSGVPADGSPCEKDAVCPQAADKSYCTDGPEILYVCADGVWSSNVPLACAPAGPLACDPVGTWKGTRTGPYDDGSTGLTDEITVEITKGDDGVLRVKNAEGGTLSADGCTLDLLAYYDSSCGEAGGESYCTETRTWVNIDFSQSPVSGSVRETCEGECSMDTTAPFAFEKQ